MKGLVLWCDSDIKIERSAGILKAANLEVRSFNEPLELLEEYQARAAEVVGVLSSMMESGGRKERGEMNAFQLFAKCKEASYSQGVGPPVYGIISSSAKHEVSIAAGADIVVVGKRDVVQEKMIEKIRNFSSDLHKRVLWCDSSKPSSMASQFEAAGYSLQIFSGIEEMVAFIEAEETTGIAAVITSMMESGGRKEKGLMNAFAGCAKVRTLVENSSVRPIFTVVSGSAKSLECYANGIDIVACKDCEAYKAKHPGGNMWASVTADVINALQLRKTQSTLPAAKEEVSAADLAFPSYWQSGAADASEMVEVQDAELLEALQEVLNKTFKRAKDGRAYTTRDREGTAPKDFRLKAAYRIEDAVLWRNYATFRASVGSCPPFQSVAKPGGPVKTGLVSGLPSCSADVNEAYLLHGTSPEAASNIIHTGFRIDLAGTSAGCAFGKGAYLAEASTKSDEYAKHGDGLFKQMYAMLLCRTTLGRVARVEKFYYDGHETKDLVDKIISDKTHDSLLGDREAAVGTYREFIIFNRAQIYPEFALLYSRDS